MHKSENPRNVYWIVVIAALGYFVDIYDLILYNVVKAESLKSIGIVGAEFKASEHILFNWQMFGMMLGKDGKPFKTRSGDTVKLTCLLNEAIERAGRLVAAKNPHMPEDELKKVAEVVAIGAVKYADLSKNRTTDYIFNWDSMLALEGNTAPYIQYAWTRAATLIKRAAINENINKNIDENGLTLPLVITDEYEITLAKQLIQFEEAVVCVGNEGMPHIMCGYLYHLAGLFSAFYEHCKILNAATEQIRQSRLKLVLLTARTLKQGLEILGIMTVERM